MSRHRGRSLVARLTAVQVVVLGLLWLVIIALTIVSTYQRDEGDIDVELHALATSLARVAAVAAEDAAAQRIGDELMTSQAETADPPLRAGELAFQLWGADGSRRGSSRETPAMPDQPPGLKPAVPSSAQWYIQGAWDRTHQVYAVVGKHEEYYRRRVGSTTAQLVLLWLGLAALSGAAFYLSFRWVIRPVRKLAERVAARASDDLTPVDEAGAFNELAPLLAALNSKLARIREMRDNERQFFADAAHELRTPLAALGAQAHVLAHTTDESERLQALRIIEGGIERSARVISKLLALGKLEGSDVHLRRRRHDMVAIARAVLETYNADARRRQQHLVLDTVGSIEADCDGEQIGVLIENLVENAIRYCPAGSSIHVELGHDGDRAFIRVVDDGPGVAAADRERAFARFERLGASESGTGLGLAIVRRIAELHGGTASLSSGSGGRGTSVEIRF